MRKFPIIIFALVFITTACLPGQNPADVQGQVETAVAETMAAQQQIDQSVALTVAAQNPQALQFTASPTFTETPTSEIVAFPTLTPIIPTITPHKPASSGGGGSVSKPEYSCDIIHQRPFDNTEFLHDADFDIKWTILNNGTKTWPAGVDVKYYSGPKMTTATIIQIPVEMKPKDQFDIVLDAKAPSVAGFYVMTWIVQGQYCWPYIAINVRN